MERLKYLFTTYKAYFIIIFGVILIFLFLLLNGIKNLPEQSSPSTGQQNASQLKAISPIITKEVKNLHWINNTILTYTYFSSVEKRLVLAQLIDNKEQILLNTPEVKLSELYWSSKNDLLIFDYGVPYKTYLLPRQGQLRQLPLQGYAFSWSPQGDEIFYINSLAQDTPELYNLTTTTPRIMPKTMLPFQFSYWSKTENKLALYNVDMETGAGTLSVFPFNSSTTSPESELTNVRFPTLSPNGAYLAYSDINTVYRYNFSTKEEKQFYKSPANDGYISFGWLNNTELLVIDTNTKTPIFKVVRVTGEEKDFPLAFTLRANQRINVAVSPNGEKVALASEKDGLFIIDLTD